MNLLRTVGEKKERFLLYNSLAILVKAVEGEKTTVDLRNEASIFGTIVEADGYMNIIMKDCVFTDARGDRYAYEMFFVQARNIRFVHIPPHLRIIPSMKEQLSKLNYKPPKRMIKPTTKSKQAQKIQQEGLMAIEKILSKQNSPGSSKNSD